MGLIHLIRSSYGALNILYRISGLINLFCRRYSRAENCAARQSVLLPPGLLNGQNRFPLAELPYGAWRMGSNGCEAIAAYNALQELGIPETLPEVAEQLERRGLLFNGFGGTNLGALTGFFRRKNVGCHVLRRRDRHNYDTAFAAADCGILSYWTGKTLRRTDKSWNTLHTVSIHPARNGVLVCNVSMRGTVPMAAASIEAFLQTETAEPVCLFLLAKPVDKS